MVFIFVFLIFVILCSMIFYMRFSYTSPIFKFWGHKSDSVSASQNIQNQIGSPEIKDVEVKITENQLSDLSCVSCDSFPLRHAELSIKSSGVEINGKTSNFFWGINVSATLTPKIENEKLVFDLTNVGAAGVTAPPKITDSLNPKLKEVFANIVPGGDNIAFKQVYSMAGYIRLVGTKK